MSGGAWAGFVLVFVVTLVATSSIAALGLAALRTRLQALGAMAERRAAEAAAIAPIIIATIAVGALVVQSTLGVDHCEAHGHHAHLCFTHGGQWVERTWVIVVLAVAGASLLGRVAIAVGSYHRGAGSIRALYAISRPAGDVRVVDSERAFCFVARRGVLVSSRVWSSLPDGERAALVAHERAHLQHGDLGKRLVLETLLLFAAPFAGERIRATWIRASEQLCDAHAAVVTDPETVARALISMCRLGSTQPAASSGFTPTVDDLAGRVTAVLAGRSVGERAARVLARSGLVAGILLAVVGVLAAAPIHHAFETLLG